MKSMKNDTAMRTSAVTLILNLVLSLGKLVAGILGRSAAMISDAVHSVSDVFSTLIVMVGIAVSRKDADKSHPYGHERLESIASIILAAILAIVGVGIGYTAVSSVLSGETPAVPTLLPLIAAVVSIAVKEWMYWYTRAAAHKVNSTALMADAWHHRSDALSSVGSFIGIIGARMGLPILDPIAGGVICLFILKAAYDILRDAIARLTDRACDDETETKIREIILGREGVKGLDLLRTRRFGSMIYIDVEISAIGSQSLKEAHAIAEGVHDAIEGALPNVKHCMVHVNPIEQEERS